MWPHVNPNHTTPPSRVRGSVEALVRLVLHLHLMHVSPQFLSFFFSQLRALNLTERLPKPIRKEGGSAQASWGPLVNILGLCGQPSPYYLCPKTHTQTHTQRDMHATV